MVSIGIDFGTYNSAASYMMPDGKVVLLQAYHGETYQGLVIPSFVKFMANGEFEKYGESARQEMGITPHLVVWGIKRLLGQTYQKVEEKGELKRFRYPTKLAPNGDIQIPITQDRVYTPVEIAKILLEKIKADCEAPFNPIGREIKRAVITHPAYFDGPQIEAIKEASKKAGFEEIELLSEPESAARAYKDIIDFRENQYVLVIDWGAGTLDIVVAKYHLDSEGNRKITSVSPPYGDNLLGGIDMDDSLMKEAKRLYNLDNLNPKEEADLRVEIEKGKIELSKKPSIIRYFIYKNKSISLKMARNAEDKESWINLEEVLERDELEQDKRKEGILKRFKAHLLHALRELTPLGIDQLILVGGPMNMPCVRKSIAEVFKENERILSQLERIENQGFPVNPLEAVAIGAGLYSSPDQGGITKKEPVSAFGYGYLIAGMVGEILIPQGMPSGVNRQRKSPLMGITPPGEAIPLSLLKQEKTYEGEKYYMRGDYYFALVVGSQGTSYTPIVELDKDLIPILKIKDHNSPNPPLTLQLSSHQDLLIAKPITPIELEDKIKNLPKEEREEYMKKLEELRKNMIDQPITAELVEKLRQDCEAAVGYIEMELKSGKSFSQDSLGKIEELKKALDDLPQGPISRQFHYKYTKAFHTYQELKDVLVGGGISENELRL